MMVRQTYPIYFLNGTNGGNRDGIPRPYLRKHRRKNFAAVFKRQTLGCNINKSYREHCQNCEQKKTM